MVKGSTNGTITDFEDVYKRQTEIRTKILFAPWEFVLMFLCVRPVSYTHLDVYKRQLFAEFVK